MNRLLAALLALVLAAIPALASDIGSSNWSETAGSNNAASPNGWTSGTMIPSQIEPTAREQMAALKRDWDHKGLTVTSGGSANAQTLTYTVAPAAYAKGDVYTFLPGFNNTGAATLNVNALGAIAIQRGVNALKGGELAVNRPATVMYDGSVFQLAPQAGDRIDPRDYCTTLWDGGTGHDVGPCINTAATIVNAAGGGTIQMPPGTYYFATAITLGNAGTSLVGAAKGNAIGSTNGATNLIYNGGAIAGPALLIGNPGGQSVPNIKTARFSIDCNELVQTCVRVANIQRSSIEIEQRGGTKTGVLINANAPSTTGTQTSDFWISSFENYAGEPLASGIIIDKDPTGTSIDVSANTFHTLSCQTLNGDCLVIGTADGNIFDTVTANVKGTGTTGNYILVGAVNYTTPSGYTTVAGGGSSLSNLFLQFIGPMQLAGMTDNSTFTVVQADNTAALAPVTINTSASSDPNSPTLTFASTTGVVAGMGATCGGTHCGVYPSSQVTAVTGTTATIDPAAVNFNGGAAVASGTPVTFSYRFTRAVPVAGGTWTLTCNASNQYTLTAPTNGHTQSGISPSGGLLTFTDLVLPWTGTCTVGNGQWTIVGQYVSRNNVVLKSDEDSASGPPIHCSPGATAIAPLVNGDAFQVMDMSTCLGHHNLYYTVANLPQCTSFNEGFTVQVTDATAPTFMAAPVGGGGKRVAVTCQSDGSGWAVTGG